MIVTPTVRDAGDINKCETKLSLDEPRHCKDNAFRRYERRAVPGQRTRVDCCPSRRAARGGAFGHRRDGAVPAARPDLLECRRHAGGAERGAWAAALADAGVGVPDA